MKNAIGILIPQGIRVLVAQSIRNPLVHERAETRALCPMVMLAEEVLVVVDEAARLMGFRFVNARLNLLSIIQP